MSTVAIVIQTGQRVQLLSRSRTSRHGDIYQVSQGEKDFYFAFELRGITEEIRQRVPVLYG